MVTLFDEDGQSISVAPEKVEKMITAGYSRTNPKAAVVTGNDPTKKPLKGANATLELDDPKLREHFEKVRNYRQQFAVGGIPEMLSTAYPYDKNMSDGEVLAHLTGKALNIVEKKSRNSSFYFALKVEIEHDGQTATALILPGRGALPMPGDIVELTLKVREENESKLTLNVKRDDE